jgi:hypothetical protein
MNTIRALSLLCLLVPNTYANEAFDRLAALASVTQKALTSEIAVQIYAGIAVSTGTFVAKELLNPWLQKYRKITKAESPQEMQLKIALNQESLKIESTRFQFEKAKLQEMQESFPDYEQLLKKKIEQIKESQEINEEEKQAKIKEIATRIEATRSRLEQGIAASYERMVAKAA